MKEKYDLIVIGGGASGMMAAGAAAENGKKVLILEKNPRLGEKLSITGGGRCNVTNATFDVREFLKKFGDSAKFLFSPFSQFNIQDTFDFFEKRNLPLVVEARNRAFPKTQKASDVVKVMKKYASGKNINISTGNPVIKVVADKEQRNIKYIETRIGKYYADNFIIATGGSSHQETGSTGDGFKWLKKIGHTVKESSPNIVPLKASDKWVKDLSGTSLSFMKITFFVNGKKSFSKVGKILFTHFGLSGPLILNSAHKVRDLLHEGSVTAKIDCYPDTDHGSLEKNILKTFDNNKNKSFKNIAKEITPPGLENALIEFHIVDDVNTKVNSVTKEERKEIVQLLKAMPINIEGLMGMDRAVISDGGIPLSEVDTRTMKSKLYDNLYLTGDILHINRPSGGYSLQLCWTTGYVAGQLG
ncbi:aminoacetone oxidase family FAD-binding enzyme [Candidatus Parcubacteria bacterium]|nr:aminoacetone oxidase family FAD-binding enzyme [Candidatus Parcubacteria bacterium]